MGRQVFEVLTRQPAEQLRAEFDRVFETGEIQQTEHEVQEVVGSVQSSVSRNLAILREAGFIQDRKEGTNVYFSPRRDMSAPAQELFKLLRERIGDLPQAKGDRARLENCLRRRLSRSRIAL